MTTARHILALALIICFASCNKSSDDTNVIINIENEFEVSLLEELSPGDNLLTVKVVTVDPLDCTNYEIIHSHSVDDRKIVASIDFIESPESCDPGTVHASTNIRLKALENGVYDFEMNLELNTIINSGTLIVSNTGYTVELDTEHGIEFSPKYLHKIPNEYIWGQIVISSELENTVIDDFMNELRSISMESELAAGNYGHFEIGSNGNMRMAEADDLTFQSSDEQTFVFAYADDATLLTELVNDYRTAYPNQIFIQLLTSSGEQL